MKNNSIGKTMRIIAGVVYGLYTLVLMFTMRFFLIVDRDQGVSVTLQSLTPPWIMYLTFILVGALMSIWLLSSNDYLSSKSIRSVVVGTVFTVAFYMISYSVLSEAIRLTLVVTFGMEYKSTIWEIVIFAGQLVLMILAAFFVTCAKAPVINESVEEIVEIIEIDEVKESSEDDSDTQDSNF